MCPMQPQSASFPASVELGPEKHDWTIRAWLPGTRAAL